MSRTFLPLNWSLAPVHPPYASFAREFGVDSILIHRLDTGKYLRFRERKSEKDRTLFSFFFYAVWASSCTAKAVLEVRPACVLISLLYLVH